RGGRGRCHRTPGTCSGAVRGGHASRARVSGPPARAPDGFRTAVVDDMKVVDLDDTEPLWAAILAETAEAGAGYALRSWRDVCPDELVAGYCALMESFNNEAPTGDLEVEPVMLSEHAPDRGSRRPTTCSCARRSCRAGRR
ncbi:MAG: hypothetical protein ACRDPR_16330, partial [Nocardioidaceae bacterium]